MFKGELFEPKKNNFPHQYRKLYDLFVDGTTCLRVIRRGDETNFKKPCHLDVVEIRVEFRVAPTDLSAFDLPRNPKSFLEFLDEKCPRLSSSFVDSWLIEKKNGLKTRHSTLHGVPKSQIFFPSINPIWDSLVMNMVSGEKSFVIDLKRQFFCSSYDLPTDEPVAFIVELVSHSSFFDLPNELELPWSSIRIKRRSGNIIKPTDNSTLNLEFKMLCDSVPIFDTSDCVEPLDIRVGESAVPKILDQAIRLLHEEDVCDFYAEFQNDENWNLDFLGSGSHIINDQILELRKKEMQLKSSSVLEGDTEDKTYNPIIKFEDMQISNLTSMIEPWNCTFEDKIFSYEFLSEQAKAHFNRNKNESLAKAEQRFGEAAAFVEFMGGRATKEQVDEGQKLYNKAVLNRATCRLKQNKIREAISDCKEVLKIEPLNLKALFISSKSNLKDGNIYAAKNEANKGFDNSIEEEKKAFRFLLKEINEEFQIIDSKFCK
eukprot:GHVP01056046.1.p1 GENE.GHVP01056046.1~~GHVP01056046.1.p1  ORF type:complete len:487 (+),score=109.18 GHVP01056046.1:226-1686(+)